MIRITNLLTLCAFLAMQLNSAQLLAQQHPLLPGIRSSSLHNAEWPVSLHDPLLTGFSPLKCGMEKAPELWSEFHLGGKASEAIYLDDEKGNPFLLIRDSRLRRIDHSGKEVWRLSSGNILFHENVHGFQNDGGLNKTLGLQVGNTLQLVNPLTGKIYWQKTFPGSIGPDKIRIGKTILPNPGKQIFIFPKYANEAYCFGFIKGKTKPVEIWKAKAGVKDWPLKADHGVSTLIEPDGSVVWNIRHHTINMHDVISGNLVKRFEFKINGEFKRNYGPSVLGESNDGKKLIGVIGQFVQNHVSCFTRSNKNTPESVFNDYIGEVYREHGVQLWVPVDGLGDIDADGDLDIVYSKRVVKPKVQTQTVIKEAGTGEEKIISDSWIAGIADLDQSGKKTLFVYSDPDAEMTRQGKLEIYQLDQGGQPDRLTSLAGSELLMRVPSAIEQPDHSSWSLARMERPVKIPLINGWGVLIRDHLDQKIKMFSHTANKFEIKPVNEIPFESEVLAVGNVNQKSHFSVVVQLPEGVVKVIPVSVSGEKLPDGKSFSISLSGGGAYVGTAADLMGDKACELIVKTPNERMNVYSFNSEGKQKFLWSGEFQANETSSRLGPAVFDLDGDAQKNVIGFGKGKKGNPSVILYDRNGKQVWESILPMSSSAKIVKWAPGNFFGSGHAGLFVSSQLGQTIEKSFMIDGHNGKVIWEGNPVELDRGTRAMNPIGLPVVYDANSNGKDDLLLDYRDYMAVIEGDTGKYIQPPINIGGKIDQWIAYNSLLPIFKPEDRKPSFLVMLGYGGIGLFQNDFQTNIWYHSHEYEMPPKVGMVDVDGDGELEIGYDFNREGSFSCRDAWTGKEKWKIKLPGKGYGPVVSADFDGDGKGEFLIGRYCIGTNANGNGEIRWEITTPVSQWPVIADFDGDGKGEIAMTCSDGTVRILKGK